jgi:hypothetical protein
MSDENLSKNSSPEIDSEDLLISLYATDPVAFVEEELGETPSKDQAEFLQAIADLDQLHYIISAGRGSGKTIALAWVLCWSAACLPRFYGEYNVCVVGGSLDQAKRLYAYFKKYIFKTPLLYEKLKGEPTMTKTEFQDAWVQCLAASEKQVRSPHPELLIFDEVCQAEDNIVESALPMTASSRHGREILCSTPNQMFHIFKRYWDQAESFGFRKFGPWDLHDCPWVKKDKIEHAKQTYSESRYLTEIMGQFTKEEAALFDPKDIDTAFSEEFQNGQGEIIAGLDWGQTHPTVLTLAHLKGEEVRVFHQAIWQDQRYTHVQEKIIELCEKVGCSTIYADSSHSGENERLEEYGLCVEKVQFSTLKDDMVENLLYLLEKRKLKVSSELEQLKYQLSTYRRVKKTSGRASFSKVNDDCVDSLMLALWGLKSEIGTSERFDVPFAI